MEIPTPDIHNTMPDAEVPHTVLTELAAKPGIGMVLFVSATQEVYFSSVEESPLITPGRVFRSFFKRLGFNT